MAAEEDFTFSSAFAAASATEEPVTTLRTWDSQLPRDPRLLVPVDVQAMVVAPGATVEHAVFGSALMGPPDQLGLAPDEPLRAGTRRSPAPFTDGPPRPAGVYLHWALPDGLTQGRAIDSGGGDGGLELRPLPNRWLVVRAEPGRRRRLRSWVVESERGRAVPLGQWREGGPDDRPPESAPRSIPPADLTAVVGGDVAWAAVFDCVRDRFGFYDPLEGVAAASRIAYVVVGWYSVPDLDPLAVPVGGPSFEELMTALGWDLDPGELRQARADARRRAVAAAQLGLKTAKPDLGPAQAEVDVRETLQPTAEWQRKGRARLAALEAEQMETEVPLGQNAALAAKGRATTVKPSPWAPRQSLYHGALYGVRTDDAALSDPKPGPDLLEVAVGATGAEALSALLAAAVADESDSELAERLQNALAYGLIDALQQPDGLARLDEEQHVRPFASEARSVPREERVRVGDPFAGLRSAPATGKVAAMARALTGTDPTEPAEGGADASAPAAAAAARAAAPAGDVASSIADPSTAFTWHRADETVLPDALLFRTHAERLVPSPDPRRVESVRRAMPRFFFPQDPVLVVRGARRSLRHGYDGRFEPDDRLSCRLSGQTVKGIAGLVSGADLALPLGHGGLPPECQTLLEEALTCDFYASDDLGDVAVTKSGLDRGRVMARLEAEMRLQLYGHFARSEVTRLAPASLVEGTVSSPVGTTYWRQAWVPLFIEWELELSLDRGPRNGAWELDELDFAPRALLGEPEIRVLRGRSLLTASPAKAFAGQVFRLLEEEKALDDAGRGVLTPQSEAALRQVATVAEWADAVAAGLGGLGEQLLGFETDMGVAPEGQRAPRPLPTLPPLLLRSGTAHLSRLRLLDAFGRTVELPKTALDAVRLSATLRPPTAIAKSRGATAMLLRPRILRPSRLLLRLVDAFDDAQEATVDQSDRPEPHSPVAAWLLPDHVDDALELFDPSGHPMGQLRHGRGRVGVLWEGAPGLPEPMGTAPRLSVANRHAAAFATELVRRDAAERADAEAAVTRQESPLSALLRVIDTTLWTVDPFGQTGTEHTSLLVGRPVAMVRAALTLQVADDLSELPGLSDQARTTRQGAYDELSRVAFDVRLGALTRFDDALIGYFVDDDYSRLYPVHASVPAEALPSGPLTGYQGAPADVSSMGPTPSPILTPYVVADPTVSLRPGQTLRLTLLMDPAGKVHVTSGLVPRKSVALLRDWISDPLARISPSFRFGPVLVDPTTVRMPKPAALDRDQVWTRRQAPATWRDDPIIAATQDALLPDVPPVAEEGYLRVALGRTGPTAQSQDPQ